MMQKVMLSSVIEGVATVGPPSCLFLIIFTDDLKHCHRHYHLQKNAHQVRSDTKRASAEPPS